MQDRPSNVPPRAAGPGAIEDKGIAPKPLLEGASEYEYVTLLNPLPVDFVGVVGITRAANMPFQVRHDAVTQPFTTSEDDVVRNYGLNLKNRDHVGRINIQNKVTIPAGKTINLLGNEAQVICKQLVNEMMQREKKSLLLADPHARHEVEERVVLSRRSVNDILGRGPMTVEQQLRDAVSDTNQDKKVEDEFPTVTNPQPTTQPRDDTAVRAIESALNSDTTDSGEPAVKRGGRPKGSKNKVPRPATVLAPAS